MKSAVLKTVIQSLLITLALLCFVRLPRAQAVVPPPDGGYPNFNTAEGQKALFSLTTGSANTAVGWFSLESLATGSFNTATGAGTLLFNAADNNTALGAAALLFNTTAHDNTATGAAALLNNTTGNFNTATGAFALSSNTTFGGSSGHDNTAVGYDALLSNTTGAFNTALGAGALFSNTEAHRNTAVGSGALGLSTGSNNSALGHQAGLTSGTGNNNVYIGEGVFGVAGENDHTYIRNINTTSVSGGGTDTVTINLTTGLLGHLSSSRRYKEDVKPMERTSETLYQLKPVTYRYKKEIDSTQSPAFGLIAEEVAEVNSDLVACNAEGQPESVHYEMVNAMLLNEFLKEHRKVEEQQATIAQLKEEIETIVAHSKEQDSKIERVSAQVQMSKTEPQVVQVTSGYEP
jgi:hypothetical protein